MLSRWMGQLRAVWDLAGQLVELGEEIQLVNARIDELTQTVQKIEERTRKQDYRARKAEEHAYFAPPATAAVPQGDKTALLQRAKALGLAR